MNPIVIFQKTVNISAVSICSGGARVRKLGGGGNEEQRREKHLGVSPRGKGAATGYTYMYTAKHA